jgi:hypothetical protein
VSTFTAADRTKLINAALSIRAAGVSIIPIDSRTKRPSWELLPTDAEGKPIWSPYQREIVDERTAISWFERGGARAFAVVCGAISGGLGVLDFDVEGFYEQWLSRVGELADGLPLQQTGSVIGRQVFFHCPNPGDNQKLAFVECETEDSGARQPSRRAGNTVMRSSRPACTPRAIITNC